MKRRWSGRGLVVLFVVVGAVTYWLTPSRVDASASSSLLLFVALFVGGGVLLVAYAVLRMVAEERRVRRAAEVSRGVAFDSTTYPGRTLR